MSFKSEFNILGTRFIERNDKVAFYIIDPTYASPILEKARELERKLGSDNAMKLLEHVEQYGLKNALRKPWTSDAVKYQLLKGGKSNENRPSRGLKFRCSNCAKTFYDLGRDDHRCPQCDRPKNACVRVG
jgi:hypothetical protein